MTRLPELGSKHADCLQPITITPRNEILAGELAAHPVRARRHRMEHEAALGDRPEDHLAGGLDALVAEDLSNVVEGHPSGPRRLVIGVKTHLGLFLGPDSPDGLGCILLYAPDLIAGPATCTDGQSP